MASGIIFPALLRPNNLSDLTNAVAARLNLGAGATGVDLFVAATAAIAKAALALVKGDVGLGNVDNTSDVNKPVSTAQAAADALRVAKVGDVMTGTLTVTGTGQSELRATGDVIGYRAGGTTGYHFLNQSGSAHVGYDGTSLVHVSPNQQTFTVNGSVQGYMQNAVFTYLGAITCQADGQGFQSRSGGGVLVWIHGYRSDITGNDDFVVYSNGVGTALQIGQASRIVNAPVGLQVAGDPVLSVAASQNVTGQKSFNRAVLVTPLSLPALGAANSGLQISNGNDFNYGACFNISPATGALSIQAQRFDGGTSAYDIKLNPSGGNVDVGANLRASNAGELSHLGASLTVIDSAGRIGLRTYTVATLPAAGGVSQGVIAYVSDGGSGSTGSIALRSTIGWVIF